MSEDIKYTEVFKYSENLKDWRESAEKEASMLLEMRPNPVVICLSDIQTVVHDLETGTEEGGNTFVHQLDYPVPSLEEPLPFILEKAQDLCEDYKALACVVGIRVENQDCYRGWSVLNIFETREELPEKTVTHCLKPIELPLIDSTLGTPSVIDYYH